MPFDDLRQWIAALERAGELKRINTEADPILEVAEITDRVSKSCDAKGNPGGPALLFQNLKGHPGSQLLINQFGSDRRMKMSVGVKSYDEIAARIRMFMDVKSPQGFLDKLKMLPLLTEAGKFFPRNVPTGPCKEIIKRDKFSLLDFPVLQCWPKDGGRFITLPCVTTRDPKSGKRNLGMYRMQVYDERTTGMHWQRQKNAAEHQRERMRGAMSERGDTAWLSAGARGSLGTSVRQRSMLWRVVRWELLAARVTGSPARWKSLSRSEPIPSSPSLQSSRRRPRSRNISIAGFLRGSPVDLVKCETRRSRSSCSERDRSRRLRQSRRTAHRRSVRRSHRLLLTGRPLSCLPRHLHHASQGSHLCGDDRRQAAARRCLHGQGGRAHLSSR